MLVEKENAQDDGVTANAMAVTASRRLLQMKARFGVSDDVIIPSSTSL
jgi:hypothetical protein